MRFGVLGPVVAYGLDGAVELGPARQRTVLAVLLAEPQAPVTSEQLVDRVWGDRPPQRARLTLHSYLSRLRGVLAASGGPTVVRRAGGYLLDIEPSTVDLHRFRDLVTAARAADDATAMGLWRDALALWRGTPFDDLDSDWLQAISAALELERWAMILDRNDALLRGGHHTTVLAELTAAMDDHPLDERLAGQFMLALYNGGRQADALAHYRSLRQRLVEEVGSEPSPALRELHRQILRQELEVAVTAPPEQRTTQAVAGPVIAAPSQLPADVPGFTARDLELATLTRLAAEVPAAPLATIVGPGGMGKTALAVHWGHAHRAGFPGGQLYVNLRGFDEREPVTPREALGRLLLALGLRRDAVPDDVDAAAELFRASTADRGVLVILDNAGSAEQVRPLLPGSGCFTIVTSRDRLTGLVALNDARPVRVGALGGDAATELLSRIVGPERVAADPQATERLAGLCGQLPLALRIAAAHIVGDPDVAIGDYVDELERRDRLDVLLIDGDPTAAVAANLDLSYRTLTAHARDLYCRIGALPGEDFSQDLLTAVSGLSEGDTAQALRYLVAGHLVEQHRPRRYRMHDLVRLHAARSARRDLPEPDRDALITGFIEWHHDRAYLPIEDEESNVFLACEALRDHPKLWRLVVPLRNTINEWRSVARVREFLDVAGRLAEQHGDGPGLFRMTAMTASALRSEGDSTAAVEVGTRAVALAGDLGDREKVTAHGNLGIYLFDHGDFIGSAEAFAEAVGRAAASGNTRSQLIFVSSLIQVLLRLGRIEEAEKYLRDAEALRADALTSEEHHVRLWLSAAEIRLFRGEFDAAMNVADTALAIARQGSYGHLDMWCMQVRAQIQLHAGRPEPARRAFEEELADARDRDMHSFEPEILRDLAEVLVDLGEHHRARDLIAEARAKWPKIARSHEPFVDLVLAGAHNGLGEFEVAAAHAEAAVDAYRTMPWPARLELALLALADAHAGLGDTEAAQRSRAEADQLATVINRPRRERFRKLRPDRLSRR
ncbi:MAG: SARP family transcriptional regulator [Hamadaea sp.]|nr:SARP family transcriptional regulator [Hamadaea sp.]